MLAELNPSGRAGRNHRQGTAVLHAIEELVSLLHDREVRAEIGVKDLFEAKTAQSGNHLSFHIRAHRHAEALAEGGADGRSRLNHDVLIGVAQRGEHVGALILLRERARRARDDALAAGNAGHAGKRLLKHTADMGVKTAAVRTDNSHMLVRARGDAAAAENTLGIVAHEMQRAVVVDRVRHRSLVARGVLDAELLAERLQLAVLAALAGQAGLVVDGQKHLKRHLAGLNNLGRVGVNLHALVDGIDAGGNQSLCALYLNHADTAGADLI